MRDTLYEIVCAVEGASNAPITTAAHASSASAHESAPSTSAESSAPTSLSAKWLDKLVRRKNRETHDASRRIAKRRLLPEYLRLRETEPELLREWGVTPEVDEAVVRLLQAKPRRTASGVATITVLTKPWPCASNCLYCPSDVRMPKSYLANEPACQRAERNFFDPYLQVTSRLHVLHEMGHVTDKVELIVLGGTFNNYPLEYQRWFISELFRALNDANGASGSLSDNPKFVEQERLYSDILSEPDDLARTTAVWQREVTNGNKTYNEAIAEIYGAGSAWEEVAKRQRATLEELREQQRVNESAAHRAVGLVIETRPDEISVSNLEQLRRFGCTKIQMGIQSLSQEILDLSERGATIEQIERAFELLRLFGFKSHVHIMANLPGATPESDRAEYEQLVQDARFIPDEVKLYPCALVESSRLTELWQAGEWQPYSEEELVQLLAADVLATPPYTRISRMIRDISATDIMTGNKKTNLRQIVEARVRELAFDPKAQNSATGAINSTKNVSRETLQTNGGEFFSSKNVSRETLQTNGGGFSASENVSRETLCDRNERTREGAAVADAQSADEGGSESGRSVAQIQEMRMREISTDEIDPATLRLERIPYSTTVSEEYFLQWVTPENRLAGFLRLSLPYPSALERYGLSAGAAMIREVHVYGKVAALGEAGEAGENAQHLGLGRQLVEEACRIARAAGFEKINVISAVGTREYYRNLGFEDGELYQTRPL